MGHYDALFSLIQFQNYELYKNSLRRHFFIVFELTEAIILNKKLIEIIAIATSPLKQSKIFEICQTYESWIKSPSRKHTAETFT